MKTSDKVDTQVTALYCHDCDCVYALYHVGVPGTMDFTVVELLDGRFRVQREQVPLYLPGAWKVRCPACWSWNVLRVYDGPLEMPAPHGWLARAQNFLMAREEALEELLK